EEIRVRVVGDEDVLPAVVVEVECNYAQTTAGVRPDPGGFSNIFEGAVAIVMVKRRLLPAKLIRVAVSPVPRLLVAAPDVVIRRPCYVIGDREIEFAVSVIIEPGGARSPFAFVRDAGPLGNIREGSVAVVMVEDRTVVAEYHQIGVTVIVVISHGDAHPESAFGAHAGLLGHVSERPVAVVAIKRAAQRLLRFVKPGGRAVDQIDIEQPVGVVINPSATRPHRLNQVLLRSRRVVVNEMNPGGF